MLSPRLFPALLVALAAALGCAQNPKAPRLGPEDFPNATPPPSGTTQPSASVPRNPAVELVDLQSPEIRAAMKEFVDSGRAPLIRHQDRRFIRFPYGHSDPLLYCKPLRVCGLELQAGEQVLDVALGDTEMWHAQKMESGPAGLRSPHVIFKPVQDGVSTNAIVTTDRRVYHLGLIARVDETGDNSQSYVRHVSFYYPNETVTEWKSAEERRRDQALAVQAAQAAANEPVIPRDLHRAYEITGDTVPWRPEEVFDDGTRVYIKMPDAMHVTEAPALWVIDEFGEQILVNYRVREGHYIVDKLFGKARMAVGVGSRASEVYITRKKAGESLGASEHEPASDEMANAR